MRRAAPVLLAVAVLAVVVIGLNQASWGPEEAAQPPYDAARALARVDGAPAPLAALHDQRNELLPGGADGYAARLEALRGYPVVVNKWGSWCPPCRREFPLFQRAGADFGKRVAFLGINALDNPGAARAFLEETPVLFPSYQDPRGAVSSAAGSPSQLAPVTIFIAADGRTAFLKQGEYRTYADLRADIERYLRV